MSFDSQTESDRPFYDPGNKNPPETKPLDPTTVRCIEAASVFAHVSERSRKRPAWLVPVIVAAGAALLAGAAVVVVIVSNGRGTLPREQTSSVMDNDRSAPDRLQQEGMKTELYQTEPFALESSPTETTKAEPSKAEQLKVERPKTEPSDTNRLETDLVRSDIAKSAPVRPEQITQAKEPPTTQKPADARSTSGPNRALDDLIDPLGAGESADPKQWK
jgi:hypothetical protein